MFDDVFISELPEGVLESSVKVCEKFFEVHKSFHGVKKQKSHIENYLKALAFAEVFIEARKINYGPIPHIDSGSKDFEVAAIKKICDFFLDWQNECSKLEQAKNLETTFVHAKEEYASMLGKTIAYELSEEGYHKICHLLKEIIEDVSSSDVIDNGHKTRLLNKFKKLQEKLSIRMYHFDGLWGMIVDVWVLLSKNRLATKPIAKKAQEIVKIIWFVQCDTEGITQTSPITLVPESKVAVKQKAAAGK